jgi:hypothetical protein
MTESSEPYFDIFSGARYSGKEMKWIEAVPGLTNARERMEKLAAEKPGRYFLFSVSTDTILAKIDTGKNLVKAKPQARAKGAA